jgi:predicted NAD/FAD-dependent oxidoreductase
MEETLYYCGEATNDGGHYATVHGALEEGLAAAQRVLQSIA